MQTPDQIFDKIKSFSHGEYNDGTINKRKIEERILNNEDIFGRGIKLKKIDIDSIYPEYIFHNKNKFLDWII